jgi:uncharacterized membrane protein
VGGHGIRREIEALIQQDHPDWSDYSFICRDDFDRYREKYILSLIEEENGSIRRLEKDVLDSINANEIVARNINVPQDGKRSLGERVADKVAAFGGSWRFIFIFFAALAAWIAVNSAALLMKPFDPYPFILMNLILSCLAAVQAPIIMMSQNRQEQKDRIRAENDYKVNLKSEIEIRTLHEKVDHLLLDQWTKMMKIQELQIEILEEIRDGKR